MVPSIVELEMVPLCVSCPASSDFYFLHDLRRYTTCEKIDIRNSCEYGVRLEAVRGFIFTLKEFSERV